MKLFVYHSQYFIIVLFKINAFKINIKENMFGLYM